MTSHSQPPASGPFRPGAFVIATLSNPREKFWGIILDLSHHGLSVRGVELAAFEDLVAAVKSGDPYTPGVVFFPMHRVERVDLDLPEGDIHSLAERFREKTGQQASTILGGEFLAPATGTPS
jgi:hypothetical protein